MTVEAIFTFQGHEIQTSKVCISDDSRFRTVEHTLSLFINNVVNQLGERGLTPLCHYV